MFACSLKLAHMQAQINAGLIRIETGLQPGSPNLLSKIDLLCLCSMMSLSHKQLQWLKTGSCCCFVISLWFHIISITFHCSFISSDEEAVLSQFKSFGERFVKDVRSRDNPAFTSKLQYQKVIPESLKNQIAEARENHSANWLLFGFLCQQATCESLRKLLAAMIEAEDHPAMSKLGREMKAALGL